MAGHAWVFIHGGRDHDHDHRPADCRTGLFSGSYAAVGPSPPHGGFDSCGFTSRRGGVVRSEAQKPAAVDAILKVLKKDTHQILKDKGLSDDSLKQIAKDKGFSWTRLSAKSSGISFPAPGVTSSGLTRRSSKS